MDKRKIMDIARDRGIDPGKMNKSELIHAIQRAEGYYECFATKNINNCEHLDCLWRGDCIKSLSI